MDRLNGVVTDAQRRVVICYDISDDRRRQEVSEAILDRIGRVQWSHYDGWLPRLVASGVWAELSPLLDTGDRALALCLCPSCARASGSIGLGRRPESPGSSWVV